MNTETRHGGLPSVALAKGAAQATKITKITKKTNLVFFVAFVTFVIFVPPPWRVSPQGQQQSTQKPPVFRGGATYVSVDTYPTIEGRIVEGLTRDDLQIFEDGKPQTIETFEFVRADARPPDDERAAYLSAREGLELAADPRYRVIVIVLERVGLESAGVGLDARGAAHVPAERSRAARSARP